MQLTKLPGGFIAGERRRVDGRAARAAHAAVPVLRDHLPGRGDAGRGERPGWLINLTNDGWFGISTGPYQHLQQARVRTIEQGLPLVRAANTGISAVIDPVGRIVESLPLGAEGVMDAPLPRRIDAAALCADRRRRRGAGHRRGPDDDRPPPRSSTAEIHYYGPCAWRTRRYAQR